MKVVLSILGALLLTVAVVHSKTGASFAPPTASSSGLTVASLNLARETDVNEIISELRSQGLVPAADILLFQEVAKPPAGDVGEAIGRTLGYSTIAIPSDAAAPNQGLTILSRAPLEDVRIIPLKHFDLKFHTRARFAVSALTHLRGQAVRIWNVHLDTRINPNDRLAQLEPVIGDASHEKQAAIIGGDFNTVDFRWLFNVIPFGGRGAQGAAVRQQMQRIGFAPALPPEQVTYPFLNQHLDWIFARGLKPAGSGVVPMNVSDHHAVWASLSR